MLSFGYLSSSSNKNFIPHAKVEGQISIKITVRDQEEERRGLSTFSRDEEMYFKKRKIGLKWTAKILGHTTIIIFWVFHCLREEIKKEKGGNGKENYREAEGKKIRSKLSSVRVTFAQ